MKKLLYGLAALAIIILGIFIATHKTSAPTTETPTETEPQIEEKVRNLSISYQEIITKNITITGEAAGLYFEGSFPITLTNPETGDVASTFIATAQGDWMTTNFVPFTANLDIAKVPAGEYTLTFWQDDPSDGESGNEIYTYSLPITISK